MSERNTEFRDSELIKNEPLTSDLDQDNDPKLNKSKILKIIIDTKVIISNVYIKILLFRIILKFRFFIIFFLINIRKIQFRYTTKDFFINMWFFYIYRNKT